jgi:hypothetical protein
LNNTHEHLVAVDKTVRGPEERDWQQSRLLIFEEPWPRPWLYTVDENLCGVFERQQQKQNEIYSIIDGHIVLWNEECGQHGQHCALRPSLRGEKLDNRGQGDCQGRESDRRGRILIPTA